MNDNPPPFGIHPDDQLEARLTAWVLGEASPFEIAELESLVAKSPELQLFLNRTRALHALLQEAETVSNTPSEEWKLPNKKRAKLSPILGDIHVLVPEKESRIRRASFRAAWGIAAVFVVTFFSLRLLPRDYEAEAVIEIKPRERMINPLGGMSHEPTMTPQFFGTEFNKIKSRNSLEKVVDDLDLTARWNTDKETALKRLKNSVETENIRGTDLISIRVRQPDEQDAKEITRAVTEGYRDYRNTLEKKSAEKSMAELKKAVREQEDKVEERRKVLTTISRTKDIIYRGESDANGQGGLDQDAAANRIAKNETKKDALERSIDTSDYVDAKRDFQTDLALLEQMKIKLISEGISSGLPNESIVVHDDPAITGRKFPSNPLAALKKAITPDAKSSMPLARAELATSNSASALPEKQIEIAGNIRTKDKVIRREVPAEPSAELESAEDSGLDAATAEAAVHIGGQVRTPGLQKFKEGLTLGDAVASAGGATEFGSTKRVKLLRDGKVKTYDLTDERLAQIELKPNDTIEMPQKNWLGCGASRDEVLKSPSEPPAALANKEADFGDADAFAAPADAGGFGGGGAPSSEGSDKGRQYREPTGNVESGLRAGEKAISRNTIDAILNDPDRTLPAAKPAAPTPSEQPASEMSGLAQREVTRRQSAVSEADRNLLGGRDAYAKGDYDQAVDKYKEALQQLPDSPATAERRESYTEHLNDDSIALARKISKVGKYEEARELLKQAISAAPEDARIKQEIAYLDDPIRTSPALTYEHQKSVEEVRRKLYMAEGNYELGKYDDAKKAYEDTLRIDPYNKAARRGMEKIAAAKSNYYRAAYDNTRSEQLMDVDKAWELEVPAKERTADLSPPPEAKSPDQDARAELLAEVDKAWNLSVPADQPPKGGVENELDLYAEPAAPGEIGSLTGLFSDGIGSNFKNSAESDGKFGITLRSGAERSDISVIREFEYPSEFEPPELPGSIFLDTASESWLPVTPATPTDFESYFESRITGAALDDTALAARLVEDADPKWDTSDVMAKTNGEGGVEYEIHAGHTSEYLFRGLDLSKKQKPIDLADLSEEIPAAQEPFSTFSLNISDASFQLALAAVDKGERPDPAGIKPEQFYNAVDYDDPAPTAGEPVAAAIGQLAHPVIPGRNLVRMSVRTASTGRAATQPLVLTLLVDQSGSMARADRRAAMDTALAQLATLLTENDRITVIGFSRTPRLLADSISGDDAKKLPNLINVESSEGGTNLEEAIDLAEDLALRHQLAGAQNRIVLFTDGAANLGDADPTRLAERIKTLRQKELAFDIAGIGTNETNDALLSELARHGNGRYYLVGENTGQNLAKQLAGAFRPAAENVKIQVKFNPQRVGGYKLIGFEKDRLNTEDFRNDSVDAAELAADESGTALYQVEPIPNGSGEIGELFVRFRDTSTDEMVERSWTIPYESQAPAIDRTTPQMQLATLSLLAAQKIQGGPLADAINITDLAPTIARLKQAYANDEKAQRLLTLINALR